MLEYINDLGLDVGRYTYLVNKLKGSTVQWQALYRMGKLGKFFEYKLREKYDTQMNSVNRKRMWIRDLTGVKIESLEDREKDPRDQQKSKDQEHAEETKQEHQKGDIMVLNQVEITQYAMNLYPNKKNKIKTGQDLVKGM